MPVLVVTAVTLFLVAGAQAVHGLSFQLDGDVLASTTTNVGGSTQTLDWDSLFDANGNEKALPAGFTASGFHKDFNNSGNTFLTNDTSTFATGSKDTLPITPGWQCNFDNNVNSKVDVMNSYAAAFTAPNGDQILYFALERNTNTGDANVGFWFLQDEVGCESTGGSAAFSGDHVDGDLLIVSAFTKGGDVSTIDVYRWNGGANGSLGTTPVAHGVDCRSASTPAIDTACATANTASITTPWLTANFKDGVGHTLLTSEFFEGGLNLTAANLGGKCFNTFLADTRSSQSLTATLFDYSLGVLGQCTSTTETTPVDNAGDPIPPGGLDIPADPNDASILVKDKATVTVTGASSFNGTLSFHLCGPFAAGSSTLCSSGGVAVDSQNITAAGTYTSAAATVTSAGRYCWRADFSGDSSVGVPASSDSRASECFVVNPRQPTLTTDATDGPVDFGLPISDTVTLSNTAHKPGTGGPAGSTDGSINPATLGGDATGNIIVTAYGPDSCSTVAFTSGPIAASGDGTYGGAGSAFEFTPTAPGQYIFVASYAGDLPNTLGIAATACSAAPEEEKVTVRQIPTAIKTKQSWIPNDTATISATIGNLGANGTVLFALYDNATCSGAALYSESVNITGGSPSEEVSTSNTGSGPNGFKITTGYNDAAGSVAGPYSWKVVYTPAAGDTAHTGKQSSCDAEHFAITYTNDPGPGSNLP